MCPPKTGSRFVERYVSGPRPTRAKGEIDGVVRHTRIADLSPEQRGEKSVYCLARSPEEWYPSWWAHMARQPFPHRKIHHSGGLVPTGFRDALYRYCFRTEDTDALRGAPEDPSVDWTLPDDPRSLLVENAKRARPGCPLGFWSFVLRFFTEERDGSFDPSSIEWIVLGPGFEDRLRRHGFRVSYSSPVVGAGGYQPPRWDDEMVEWVERCDGELLRHVLPSRFGSRI